MLDLNQTMMVYDYNSRGEVLVNGIPIHKVWNSVKFGDPMDFTKLTPVDQEKLINLLDEKMHQELESN